jgi:hypothetical protein
LITLFIALLIAMHLFASIGKQTPPYRRVGDRKAQANSRRFDENTLTIATEPIISGSAADASITLGPLKPYCLRLFRSRMLRSGSSLHVRPFVALQTQLIWPLLTPAIPISRLSAAIFFLLKTSGFLLVTKNRAH